MLDDLNFLFLTGTKTSSKSPSLTGQRGIYVNINGTKGHYITKDLEILQGHSNTRNENENNSSPPGWGIPPTYPSQYEPIHSNATSVRWKPSYEQTSNKPNYTPVTRRPFATESPESNIQSVPQRPTSRGPRNDPSDEVPTESIEEDYHKKENSRDSKADETSSFAEVAEPDPDKYDVDVLDEKESWKPSLAFQNKTKQKEEDDTSVVMSINKRKNVNVEILDVKLAPWHEGK